MAAAETVVGFGVLLAVGSVTAAIIVNGAVGTYQDSKGQGYGAVSNTASVATASISAAMVEPKATAPDPTSDAATHGTAVVKTFTITNDSNITDAYVIAGIATSAGSVQSIVFQPSGGGAPIAVTPGSTVSPPIPPGGTITVLVTVSTAGAAVGSNIQVTLTAKTTARSQNGPQTDIGKQWVYVARGPQMTGLAPLVNGVPEKAPAAGFPVLELVNGQSAAQAEPGTTLSFSIPFTNSGDAPAYGLTVSMQLPPHLAAVAGSVKLQATDHRTGKSVASLNTRTGVDANGVSASLAELDPGTDVTVVFQAATSPTAPVGSVVSTTATLAAQAMPNVVSAPAMVFIGAMDIVYDALGGAAHPIAGATVSILDSAGGQKAKLAAAGSGPNAADGNPFTTASSGAFGFTLAPASSGETAYELDASAPGYVNRRIKVDVVTGKDGLPATTLTALDELPLATAGAFNLTSAPVAVAGISGFFGNVPLFSPQMLSLALTADRSVASAGDRLAYSVDFGPGNKPLAYPGELTVLLPPSISYATGTARIGAIAGEPAVSGKTLTWPLKDLTEKRTLTFDAVVMPGVTPGATLATRAHLAALLNGTPLGIDGSVTVAVVGGALSSRSILTGRVFSDHAHDGRFAAGDAGVAGVRIFLEDGESVLTDRDGRFSFPAARPGMHVLHLDPITLPTGVHAYHGFPVNDPRSSERLVHGIFDSGLMSDVNFAVSETAGH